MSYRDNHPNPPVWTSEQSDLMHQPEPYDRSGSAALFEIDSPDGLTQFLVSVTGDDFRDSGWPEYFTFYGIEAPRTCKMRHGFEWGEISWRDYWTHKEWLLHMRSPCRLITSLGTFMRRLISLATKGPTNSSWSN